MNRGREREPQGQQPDKHPNYDVRLSFLTQRRVSRRIVDTFVANGGNIAGDQTLGRILRPVLRAEGVDAMVRQNGQGGEVR